MMLRGEEGGRVKGGAAVERVRDAMRMSTERRGSIVVFLVARNRVMQLLNHNTHFLMMLSLCGIS